MATAELETKRSEIAERYGIDEEDLDELELSGVKLPNEPFEIGRGLTRVVYRAMYKRGLREMEVALKIPMDINPEDSIIGYLTTRRDVNTEEAEIHNTLEGHNRIIPILGTVETSDGRTMSFEPLKKRAMSLEDYIRDHGKITDETRAVEFIGNLIDPFLHLAREKVVHRDVKPSNVLMTSNGPMLTDFQHASYFSYSRYKNAKHIPTRGGTAYTRYTLTNGLMKSEETDYGVEDEMYSIAATILYALTGKDPFDYKLKGVSVDDNYKASPKDKIVEADGRRFLIKLSSGGKDLEEITERENTKRVREAISRMDSSLRKKYGSLLERALIPEHRKPITHVEDFKREFERINSSFYLRLKERLIGGAKFVLPTAVAAGICGFLIGGFKYFGDTEREAPPTVAEMLRHEDYMKYNLSDLEQCDKRLVYPILVPYMKKAEQVLPEIEEVAKKRDLGVEGTTFFAESVHRMPKRLVSAWIRACYMNLDLLKKYGNNDKEKRLNPSFVPEAFMITNSQFGFRPGDIGEERVVTAHGIMYLKLCLGPNQTVEDTFTDYFSSRVDQSNSITRVGCANYLPRVVDFKVREGYHKFLPHPQRELINSAVALYLITDEKGEIHYDWIPQIITDKVSSSGSDICTIVKDIHEKRELTEISEE